MSSPDATSSIDMRRNTSQPEFRALAEGEFRIERKSVTVSVPATSANMGSGYDCIGMAVDIWNDLTLTRADKFSITCEGDGAEHMPRDDSNLVVQGVKRAFQAAGIEEVPPLHYHLVQRIPFARGLGSSSAAIVSGVLAGLALVGHKLDCRGKEELLQIATDIEGHPDNVAPAIYGGIQLGIFSKVENRWMTQRVRVPHGLIFVLFIPPHGTKSNTHELRKCVPKEVSMEDAVFNMGRLAWLVASLLSDNTEPGHLNPIREGFEDRLHQDQRADAVYSHLNPMIEAAYGAGASGVYLSGAGPAVMAICPGGHGDFFTQRDSGTRKDAMVAKAMNDTALKLGVEGSVYITHPTSTGGCVVGADPPYSSDLVTYNGGMTGEDWSKHSEQITVVSPTGAAPEVVYATE